MESRTFCITSLLLVSLMLFGQCAVSISWVRSISNLAQIENIDFTNKTGEKNETDAEDDTEEEKIMIRICDSSPHLEPENQFCHIAQMPQSLFLDLKEIPPKLS